MIQIIINNNRSKVEASAVDIKKLVNHFQVKAPGYFWSEAWRSRKWDGYFKPISESGAFNTGMVPQVIEFFREKKKDIEITDRREDFTHLKIPKRLGNLEARDYQYDSVKSIVENELPGNVPFPRGIIDEATNAGKTLIAAMLFKSYPKNTSMLYIVNRVHLYSQALLELPELIGKEEIGTISSEGIKWNRFMICTAQTLKSRLSQVRNQLSRYKIVLIDECHYTSSPTFKVILSKLEDAYVRVGMSGTPLKHKDKTKNIAITSYFGSVLHKTSNKDLILKGVSVRPVITILQGNESVKVPGSYPMEEEQGIINNIERNKNIYRRIRQHVLKDRLPIMVTGKRIKHVEKLYKGLCKRYPELKIGMIHTDVSDKQKKYVLEAFKDNRLDILVSSLLIKEGQNLPLMRVLMNVGGGDSAINITQLVGRALRMHSSKKGKMYIDDFYDTTGAYIRRHSLHRLKVYKDEGFKIVDKIKGETINSKY